MAAHRKLAALAEKLMCKDAVNVLAYVVRFNLEEKSGNKYLRL